MAINKKLIHFETLTKFQSADGINTTSATQSADANQLVGNIPYHSIVFIKDVCKFWTHGKYYDCNNTWRGIQNNLTSTSTTDSLSAAQGKALNDKFANYLYTAQVSATQNNITWAQGIAKNHRRAFYYNTSSTEWSYLFGFSSSSNANGDVQYGAVLKMGYTDRYLRILRVSGGTWQSADWEKIYAGYADSAGSVTNGVYTTGDQTISGNKTFSGSTSLDDATIGNLVVTGGASFAQTINGNAATANKVNHTLTFTGYSTGTFDGSADKSIAIPSNTNQLTNGAGFITASSNITGTSAGITGYTFKSGITNTANSGWTNTSTDDKIIPTMNFIAYWNGAYNSGGSSNLTYCCKGAFGTATTHAHTDYVTSITYDSSTKKLQQSKGGGTATDIVTFGSNAFNSTAYLPLSNTASVEVTFTVDDPSKMLKIKRGSAAYSMIMFANTSGNLGMLGFTSSSVPTYRTASGTDYTLYHTGNLSPMTTSHAANGITSTKISNWDSVYTWYTTAAGTSASGVIDNWNEIKNFIDGFHESDDLAEYLVNTFVAKTGGTMTGALTTPGLTVTGASSFSQAINGSILGNAATASRLQNARTITIGSQSNSFDGSANISYSLSSMGAFASSSFTKANIKSTLGISDWALNGTKPSYAFSEITGTVTNAQLAGSIANGKLSNSKITIAGTDVSLGGSITADTLKTNLGLGSNAYSSTSYLPLAGGKMTGAAPITFTENKIALDFRPYVAETQTTYGAKIEYMTAGNEALVFGNKYKETSFIFKCGSDLTNRNDWNVLFSDDNKPSLQIKRQSVYINAFIASGTAPSYNLYVGGTTYSSSNIESGSDIIANGDIRAKGNDFYIGSASGSQCHQQYDSTNKVLKFIFD